MGQKILLIQLRQLGDIILTTPCIREIKKQQPDSEISFLCHEMGQSVLSGNPHIDHLYLYNPKNGFLSYLNLLINLRKKNFDLVLDFMSDPRSAFFTMSIKSVKKLAISSRRDFVYHDSVPRGNGNHYIVKEKFALLEKSGFNPQDQRLEIYWTEKNLHPTRDFFNNIEQREDMNPANLKVILSPTHRRANRKWPIDRYAQLADLLVQEWNAIVTWIWGPGEEDEIDYLQTLCKTKTFKAPKCSFKELAAFIQHHDLFIGNSNGPSHLATAADIYSLQLHGHTNARSWCPLTDRHQAIQSSEFGKTDFPTLNPITLEDVWAKLENMKPLITAQSQKHFSNSF